LNGGSHALTLAEVTMCDSGMSVAKAETLERLVREIDRLQSSKSSLEQELKQVRANLRAAQEHLRAESEGIAPVFQRAFLRKATAKPKHPPASKSNGRDYREEAILRKVASFGRHGFHIDDLVRWFKGDLSETETVAAVEALAGQGLVVKDEKGFVRAARCEARE